jgi:hypothetical protein
MTHLYALGQSVSLAVQVGIGRNTTGLYKVTKLLPPLGVEFQYRIRSEGEAHERVVVEHQIKAVRPKEPGTRAGAASALSSETAAVFAKPSTTEDL